MNEFEIQTTTHGAVTPAARERAEQKIARLAKLAQRPILFARLELRQEPHATLERPAVAKASLDVSGHRVRAHVAAPTMDDAADLLEARLRGSLEVLAERRGARRHRPGIAVPGTWHHGDLSAQRPAFLPRPPEDRRLVRRATFRVDAISPEEAAVDMELLHHDFLLFHNANCDADSAVYRRDDGSYGLIGPEAAAGRGGAYVDSITEDPVPAPQLSTEQAIERLDSEGGPFVFFTNDDTGRGAIVYRRYDGHYGLLEPRTDTAPQAAGEPVPGGGIGEESPS